MRKFWVKDAHIIMLCESPAELALLFLKSLFAIQSSSLHISVAAFQFSSPLRGDRDAVDNFYIMPRSPLRDGEVAALFTFDGSSSSELFAGPSHNKN